MGLATIARACAMRIHGHARAYANINDKIIINKDNNTCIIVCTIGIEQLIKIEFGYTYNYYRF